MIAFFIAAFCWYLLGTSRLVLSSRDVDRPSERPFEPTTTDCTTTTTPSQSDTCAKVFDVNDHHDGGSVIQPQDVNDHDDQQKKNPERRGIQQQQQQSRNAMIEPLHKWKRTWALLLHNVLSSLQAISDLGHDRDGDKRMIRQVLESARSIALTDQGKRLYARTWNEQSSQQQVEEESPLVCYDKLRETSESSSFGYTSDPMEPYIGMLLDIFAQDEAEFYNDYDHDRPVELASQPKPIHYDDESEDGTSSCRSTFVIRYQLLEPLHLQLGTTKKHTMDYAYIPVVADKIEPVNAHLQVFMFLSSMYKNDDGRSSSSSFFATPQQQQQQQQQQQPKNENNNNNRRTRNNGTFGTL